MSEIPIKNGMRLRLNNVLSRSGGMASANQYAKACNLFDAYIKTKNLVKYGPIVIHNQATGNDSALTIMTQVREAPATVDPPFEFTPELVVENCIMVRFEGPESAIPIAQSKAAVFAYEHDVKLSGSQYSVIKEKADGMVSIDLFVEVLPE